MVARSGSNKFHLKEEMWWKEVRGKEEVREVEKTVAERGEDGTVVKRGANEKKNSHGRKDPPRVDRKPSHWKEKSLTLWSQLRLRTEHNSHNSKPCYRLPWKVIPFLFLCIFSWRLNRKALIRPHVWNSQICYSSLHALLRMIFHYTYWGLYPLKLIRKLRFFPQVSDPRSSPSLSLVVITCM